jgi:hypothetical protein
MSFAPASMPSHDYAPKERGLENLYNNLRKDNIINGVPVSSNQSMFTSYPLTPQTSKDFAPLSPPKNANKRQGPKSTAPKEADATLEDTFVDELESEPVAI